MRHFRSLSMMTHLLSQENKPHSLEHGTCGSWWSSQSCITVQSYPEIMIYDSFFINVIYVRTLKLLSTQTQNRHSDIRDVPDQHWTSSMGEKPTDVLHGRTSQGRAGQVLLPDMSEGQALMQLWTKWVLWEETQWDEHRDPNAKKKLWPFSKEKKKGLVGNTKGEKGWV